MPHPAVGWLPVLVTPEEVAADLIRLAAIDLPLVLKMREETRESDTLNLFKHHESIQKYRRNRRAERRRHGR